MGPRHRKGLCRVVQQHRQRVMRISAQVIWNHARGIPQLEPFPWSRLQAMALAVILHRHPRETRQDETDHHSNYDLRNPHYQHQLAWSFSHRLDCPGLLYREQQGATP